MSRFIERAALDPELTGESLGLLVWLCHGDVSLVTTEEIITARRFGGRDKVRRCLRELIEHGYLINKRRKDSAGRFDFGGFSIVGARNA